MAPAPIVPPPHAGAEEESLLTATSPRSQSEDREHDHDEDSLTSRQHNYHHQQQRRQNGHHDGEDDDAGHDDEDEEGGAIPFPSQRDPARPLRPKHYHTKRSLSKLHAWVHRNTGFLLLALAQVFYATMALFFKILNDLPPLPVDEKTGGGSGSTPGHKTQAIGALEVIVVRMAITAAGCYLYLIFIARDPHPFLGPPAVRGLLALRGFSGFFGLLGLYYSLQFLSLADATCITFLSPLATALLAALTLGEPLHARQLISGIACVAGVLFIARPRFLFGTTPHGDLGDIPVPGGDEGGGIGNGQHLLEILSSAVQQTEGAGVAAAAAGPFAGPMGAVIMSAATAAVTPAALARATALALEAASATASSFAAVATATATATAASVSALPISAAAGPEGVTEAERIIAVAIALLGVVGSAGAYTCLRCIGTRASPTHSVAYFSTWSMLVAGIGMKLTGEPFIWPTDLRWAVLMLLIGFCGLAAQILAAMGLAREAAGRATVAVYLQAPISVFYQISLLHTPLEPLSALGSGIILLASIWVSIGKA